MVTGASCSRWGSLSASRATWSMASAKASSVSFDSVSVGSTIIASSTTSGKYTVEGWKTEVDEALGDVHGPHAVPANGLAVATNSCIGRPGKASG